MVTHACPSCRAPYSFDGFGTVACPACGQAIDHPAPRAVKIEVKPEERRTGNGARLVAILLFLFLGVAFYSFGFTLGSVVCFGIVLFAMIGK